MGKKILIIALAGPPNGASHATRIYSLINGLFNQGYDPILLTCKIEDRLKHDSPLYNKMCDMAKVIEVDGGYFRNSANYIVKKSANKEDFLQKFREVVRKHVFPDTYIFWIPNAIKELLRNKEINNVEIVISSGAPFSSHIAAYILKKILRIPYVLDYGDPWVYEPGRPRKGVRLIIEKILEKKIINNSSFASFTTSNTIELYKDKYPEAECDYYLFPMGYDKEDYMINHEIVINKKKQFVYAGRIGDEYRSLDKLINILEYENNINKSENDVEFIFYGAEYGIIKKRLKKYIDNNIVKIEPNLEHMEYIKKIRASDGLLIFGNNNIVQIPGKIPHYLAAKKPILYLCNINDIQIDPAYQLMKSIQLTCIYDAGSLAEYKKFKNSCIYNEIPLINNSNLNLLEWQEIVNKYINKIEEHI
jgi:hypothetical protein